ncbi:tetratricopeptide repeat protein [Prochlorococcus marinus]|uniref:Uncharacterized protein n=1 Tax=Prochlorococcus marinus (strain MIT 9303) TaxID=59922 RepID=A2CBB7_PROM3|nr:tetratricopeptide repeat protein [Prochlorococcus marinus]ABM78777.1 Hypothetical protein P9303_20371 [Prochlorococcus marinus str. MIT 9303]
MPHTRTALAAALSLLPLGHPLLLGSTTALATGAVMLSTQTAVAQSAAVFFNRGYAKDELKDYQGAIADYTKAIAINPQYADAYNNRGIAKRKSGDYQGAIADYNKAIEINPQDAEAYYNRGYAKDELKDYQGAIADYTKAIAIDPQDGDAYNNRGIAKRKSGDYQGAIADYSKIIEINPQDAAAYSNRGITKGIGFSDRKGACSDFKKAASLGYQYRINWLNSADGAWCRNMR